MAKLYNFEPTSHPEEVIAALEHEMERRRLGNQTVADLIGIERATLKSLRRDRRLPRLHVTRAKVIGWLNSLDVPKTDYSHVRAAQIEAEVTGHKREPTLADVAVELAGIRDELRKIVETMHLTVAKSERM